jgi:hypothetical protein
MISTSDLVCLPYTPDLTQAGISYACRSLPHTYDRMGGSHFDRLRRIVVGIAVELAFRRYLAQQHVPFDIKGATPFTDPDRYDVSLGGHRCDIKSFLISYREQIRSLHEQPSQLLDAPALVPLDQYAGDGHSPNDLYLFAFLTGLVAAEEADIQKAAEASQPLYFIHAMPPSWVRPQVWTPLGPLVLKSECDQPLVVELGGQDASREFITRALELPPRTRVQLDEGFYSLAYVHANTMPAARLGFHATRRRETYLVQPLEWGNIWVYGMRIYLAGWVTRDQFRQRAALLPVGSRVFQYDRTRTKNLALAVSQLHPIGDLLSQARA